MKHFSRLIVVLLVLVAFTGIASAARPQPEPFTTTGYTDFSSIQFEFLPNDFAKFHFRNQGGDAVDNDGLCQMFYGYPCDMLCGAFGQACGVSGYFTGSFIYDEWGVARNASQPDMASGANHGLMTITTPAGQADLRFSGIFDPQFVNAGFAFLGGTGTYKGIEGYGTKAGYAGYVFSANYTPCGGKDQPACPVDRCAVFGSDLKLKKDKAQWKISNEGAQPVTISKMTIFWPAVSPQLTQVKLGGKTIYGQPLNAPVATIASDWSGDEKDRQIGAGKNRDLWLEFNGDVSTNPWDFTILVEFEGGCAVPFVAFPPAQ